MSSSSQSCTGTTRVALGLLGEQELDNLRGNGRIGSPMLKVSRDQLHPFDRGCLHLLHFAHRGSQGARAVAGEGLHLPQVVRRSDERLEEDAGETPCPAEEI